MIVNARNRIRSHAKRFCAAAFATTVLVVAPLANAAETSCEDKVMCIIEVQQDSLVELHAKNTSAFPVTYTLRVRGSNVRTSEPRTITRTLPPYTNTVATTLRAAEALTSPQYRFVYDWTIGDRHAVHDDDYVYHLPYETGKSYRVIQSFGSRFSHTGLEQFAIDFLMREGTPVHAARGGVVARLEESNSIGCWEDGCGRYANFVVVLHDDGTTGEYYHLLKDGVLVEVGDKVTAGQKIALSGNTGHTTVAHLHFAVYRAVDWGNTQSVPVRFVSADGIVNRPRRGGRYQAVTRPAASPSARTATGAAGE